MKRRLSLTTRALIASTALAVATGIGLIIWGVLVDEGRVPSANITPVFAVFLVSVVVAVGLLFVSAGRAIASGGKERPREVR